MAQGGMGAIYRAMDQSLGVQVAVKENLFSSEEASRQFRHEATILGGLRHPNLPRVTDHFSIPGQGQYLVMDFIEGDDLRKRISNSGTLPEEEVALIGAAICDGLTYLHKRQPSIVHRDIKPGNVKITPNGQVFLVDFGLAKISKPGQATTTGAQALTPGYAPPEQYGKGTEPRSDIYALGATLYAALTGNIPEDGLARAMGSAILTPVRKHNPRVSEKLAGVVEKAMAIDPANRYQYAEELKQALLNASPGARRRIGQGGEIRVVPYSDEDSSLATVIEVRKQPSTPLPQQAADTKPSKPISPPPSRPPVQPPPAFPVAEQAQAVPRRAFPLALVLVIGFLILLAAAAAFVFLGPGKGLLQPIPQLPTATPTVESPPIPPTATTVPTSTVLPTQTNTPAATATITPSPRPSVTNTSAPTLTFTPAPTPIGGGSGQIAFVSDRTGIPQIWLMREDGSNQEQITKMADGACQPDWSPDGKRLVFVSPCRKKQDDYSGTSLFLINADGSGLTPLPSMPGGDFDPAWSPDGKLIAFASSREGRTYIYMLNPQDNSVGRITKSSGIERRPVWSPNGKNLAFESTRQGTNQIWIMGSNGDTPYEFSTLNNGYSVMATWSPKGDVIIFTQSSNLPLLIAKQFSGGAQATENKVNDRVRPVFNPRFSQDSFWLVFEYFVDGNSDIYRMMFNGSTLTRLTIDPKQDFQPVWRPKS